MRRVMLVAIAALFGCGGISKEQYGAKEAEAAKYQGAVQALEQKNAALQGQVSDLEKKLGESTAAKTELETTAAKLSEQSGEYAKMNKELEGKLTVKLSEKLLFKENSSKLTPEATKTLDAMADALGEVKDKIVFVAGYTDNAEGGGKNANAKRWQLSTARAIEVAKYLSKRGIDPSLLAVAGFAEIRAVAPNDTLANKALNRRAEIGLSPTNPAMNTIDVNRATLKGQ